MTQGLVIAAVDRAGDHAAVLGVVLLIAVVGGFVYLVVKGRARSGRDSKSDPGPEA